jgi:hypothetical protein
LASPLLDRDVSEITSDPYERFQRLDFDAFRRLARLEIDPIEKVGFPLEYRAGREHLIVNDICAKLALVGSRNRVVVDIGPGCSGVARGVIDHCRRMEHSLVLVDSAEMLDLLPDEPFIWKLAARYPEECRPFVQEYRGRVHALLAYSVVQYVFAERDPVDFVDSSLSLLAPGGRMLIGDVPNASKRRRFLASEEGRRFQAAVPAKDGATVTDPRLAGLDDAFVLSVVEHCRARGFDTYVVPQDPALPMANRREDILVVKP